MKRLVLFAVVLFGIINCDAFASVILISQDVSFRCRSDVGLVDGTTDTHIGEYVLQRYSFDPVSQLIGEVEAYAWGPPELWSGPPQGADWNGDGEIDMYVQGVLHAPGSLFASAKYMDAEFGQVPPDWPVATGSDVIVSATSNYSIVFEVRDEPTTAYLSMWGPDLDRFGETTSTNLRNIHSGTQIVDASEFRGLVPLDIGLYVLNVSFQLERTGWRDFGDQPGAEETRFFFATESPMFPIPEPASVAVWSVLAVAGIGFSWRRRRR